MKTYSTRAGIFRKPKMLGYGGSWDGVSNPYSDPPSGYSNSFTGDGAGELTYSNDTSFQGNGEQQSGGIFKGNSNNLGANIVDAGVQLGSAAVLSASNKQVNQKTGWTPDGHYRTKGGAQGIATGWSIGNKIYPGIGGIVGAFAGGIYGAFRGNKQDKEAKKEWEGNNALFRQKEQLAMQGKAYDQWSKQQGNPQTQMYKHGGKMRKPEPLNSEERTLFKTAANFIPGYEQYLDYKDATIGAATGDVPRMNQGIIGLGMPLSGKALLGTLDYVTEKTLGKEIADANESKRTNILTTPTKDLQLMVSKYGFGAYDKWVADGSPDLYEEKRLKEQQENYEMLKNVKPAPKYPTVPSNSSTTVKKPLVQKAYGGSLRKLSSDSVEVQGPSHENGGVDLPMHGAEVEGNETIHKDYVFSDRLGFASVHKKMAKSKGIIENKPISFERVASLKAIADKEQKLKLIQEQMKAQYNLK